MGLEPTYSSVRKRCTGQLCYVSIGGGFSVTGLRVLRDGRQLTPTSAPSPEKRNYTLSHLSSWRGSNPHERCAIWKARFPSDQGSPCHSVLPRTIRASRLTLPTQGYTGLIAFYGCVFLFHHTRKIFEVKLQFKKFKTYVAGAPFFADPNPRDVALVLRGAPPSRPLHHSQSL